MSKAETVYVGLSGGVDSAVAAKRLILSGHTVVGVFIKVWQPEFLTCNWEAERLDAMRVAAHLKIPFLTFDAEEAYKNEVADYMISEYKEGRTPNPDVMCNQHVKFGAFLKFARASGADKIATGHYARVQNIDSRFILKRGVDTNKDQSYFLWTLTQEQLSQVYFPVGDTPKSEIRKEALHAGIPVFDKQDSQGICFLGQVNIEEFLSHYILQKDGEVLDENGTRIGTHPGAVYFTLGQRHGFTIDVSTDRSVPQYVVAKDIVANTLTVARAPLRIQSSKNTIVLQNCNVRDHTTNKNLLAQFRYRQKPFHVEMQRENNACGMLRVLDEGVETPSGGQSCVLYDGDSCVGGGIIT